MALKEGGLRGSLRNLVDIIPDSAISRWDFEQDVSDSWGTNDGTLFGPTFTTSAAVGSYALSFDGTDDYVEVSDTTAPSSFSVSLWAYWDGSSSSYFYSRGVGATDELAFGIRDGSYRFSTFDGSSDHGVTGYSTPPTNQWVHHVGVYDNDNSEYRVYWDGSLETSASDTYGPSDADNSRAVYIGANNASGSYDRGMSGRLDDVRTYSKALTDSEVLSLYNTGSI